MANNKSVEIQHTVRENAFKIQESVLSIKQFEKEIKQKEKEKMAKKDILSANHNGAPIRSDVGNFQKYATLNKETLKEEKTAEKKAVHDIEDKRKIANNFKEKGNEFVKAKNYESAIKMYNHAIGIYPDDAVYYSNRSQCYLSLERFKESIDDATAAIKLDKTSSKSYYRRMTAYEKLNEDMKALQNCQEWMSSLPDDQRAKTNYDRIHNKLIEVAKLKEKEKIKWSRSLEATNFIDKPSHAQSTKCLRKVNVTHKRSNSPIPDHIIDKIFNNNTGENIPYETDSKLFKTNFMENSYSKAVPKKVDNKNIVNETNEILKANDKKDKIPSLDEIEAQKNGLITLPSTGPQFYAAWKELTEEQRFLYLKNMADNNVKIGKLLGAQLNSDMLVEIIGIVHKYFISYNLPYINLVYELSKNTELSVLSMFLDKEDKDKLSELLKVLKIDNDMSNMIQQIKQNFQI